MPEVEKRCTRSRKGKKRSRQDKCADKNVDEMVDGKLANMRKRGKKS